MSESRYPRAEVELISAIATLKAELFQRSVPSEYLEFQPEKNIFVLSPQNFDRYFGDAVSAKPLYNKDEYNRRTSKGMLEVRRILVEDESVMTEFGSTLKDTIPGKTFIDLGSEKPGGSPSLPRVVAGALGAKRYVGVDIALKQEEIQLDESEEGQQFQSVYIKDDILSFVSKLENVESGVVFYVSGLEPIGRLVPERREWAVKHNPKALEQTLIAEAYTDACLKEMSRVAKIGDAIIIGQGTHGFEPEKYGFELKAQEDYHRIYEKI